jgi:hypothetical protein
MDRYAHSGLKEIAAAVESLPSLNGKPTNRDHPPADTINGSDKKAADLGCTMVAQTPAPGRLQQASAGIQGTEGDGKEGEQEMPQAVDGSALGISRHPQSAEREGMRAATAGRRRILLSHR